MKKTLQRYWILLIFSLLFFLGLLIRYFYGDESMLWAFWSAVDVAFAVALGVLAFLAYMEMVHDEDEVELWFNVDGKEINTGLNLLRRDCTRGEVIGVLGMMQRTTDKRFNYDPAHLHDLLAEVNRVRKGKSNRLLIIISEKEFAQFKL